ncbi:MAG: DUF262 domain-containing protein [Akkermansia sp.]|nr:DUF262 domain-containing protein [Akkermansia sp.]
MRDKAIYSLRPKTIQELINEADHEDICIPNIQRPYVWEPHQLAHLVDSLMHGWPCGNLLLWQVEAKNQKLFLARPFVLEINAEASDDNKITSKGSGYTSLILDGQQRVQSLIIAFAKNSLGYHASAKKWNSDIGKTGGKTDVVIQKWLCFNLSGWSQEYVEANPSYYYLDYKDNVATPPLSEKETKEDGKVPMLCWATEQEIASSCGKIVKLKDVTSIKNPSSAEKWLQDKIHFVLELEIPTLNVTLDLKAELADINEDEAIVQIFTRLNTAGTPLTVEQIQEARIKSAWPDFPVNIESLKNSLYRQFRYIISTDEIVKGFNTMLLVKFHRDDLNVVRAYECVADWKSCWEQFSSTVLTVFEKLERQQTIYLSEYRALNIVWFLVAVITCSPNADKDLELDNAMLRFAFITTWAKIWANRSGQYVKGYTRSLIKKLPSTTPSSWIRETLKDLQAAAINSVSELVASHRGSVRLYYSYLWIWSRLNKNRAELLRDFGDESMKSDVDHLVPASWVPSEKRHLFNGLGNCWLLAASCNRSRGKNPFADFVENLKGMEVVYVAELIKCDESHLRMSKDDMEDMSHLQGLIESIQQRTARMKEELYGFIKEEPNHSVLYQPDVTARRESVLNVSGIYKGEDFCKNCKRFKDLRGGSPNSNLTYIRNSMRILGWSQEDIAKMLNSEDGRNKLKKTIERTDILGPNHSGWLKYVSYILESPETTVTNGGNRTTIKEKDGYDDMIQMLVRMWCSPTHTGEHDIYTTCANTIVKKNWYNRSYNAYLSGGVNYFLQHCKDYIGNNIFKYSCDINHALEQIEQDRKKLNSCQNESWMKYLAKNSKIGNALKGIFANYILSDLSTELRKVL